jgi:hypothetical protein
VTGAVSSAIAGFFGATRVHILVDSKSFSDGVHREFSVTLHEIRRA